jgi:hypothetical protein
MMGRSNSLLHAATLLRQVETAYTVYFAFSYHPLL